MNAGRITAKIRDAVPVCLIVDGEEVRRYKNIQLPNEIKATEIRDFRFDIAADGKITFHLLFETGMLPETLPQDRPLVTRADKATAKLAETETKAKEWTEKHEAKKAATTSPASDDEPAPAPTPNDVPMVAECAARIETPAPAPTPGDAPITPAPVADNAPTEAPAKKKGPPAKAATPSKPVKPADASVKKKGRPQKTTTK